MKALEKLQTIRKSGGTKKTTGLDDQIVEKFLNADPKLETAINLAYDEYKRLSGEHPNLWAADETEQIETIQKGFVNFYTEDTVNPYVALSASGPWLITTKGAVLHDNGGYGMLGLGHAPEKIISAIKPAQVMANIMTANFSQLKLSERLNREIGHSRAKQPVFEKYICVNSGSESVTVAARVSDINVANLKKADQEKVKFIGLEGGFHGRTDRPAQASDSTIGKYRSHLGSFQVRKNLVTVPPNDVAALEAAFAQAESEGVFLELMFMEPVMGEGNPGEAVTVEFYEAARRLTAKHGSLLLVDSIQASLRAQGCLSIVDYPGFDKVDPPDMETYSKAVNAGQYPLSILAMNKRAAELYVRGVYGNTMTTNPRALDVACAVLDGITPEFRKNVKERGQEFVDKLNQLKADFPDIVTDVKGTGLLVSAAINPDKFKVVGFGCLEEQMRVKGIGVIHGGENSLRFTPHFWITSAEIDLIVDTIRSIIKG